MWRLTHESDASPLARPAAFAVLRPDAFPLTVTAFFWLITLIVGVCSLLHGTYSLSDTIAELSKSDTVEVCSSWRKSYWVAIWKVGASRAF